MQQEPSFEHLPDGERWRNVDGELHAAQQLAARLQAELDELRSRSQASGQAMHGLQLEMQVRLLCSSSLTCACKAI